jgi:hypothetical protein
METTEIEKLPEQLMAARTRLLDVATEAENAQRLMKTEEQKVAWDVAMEKDGTGTAVYKNELMRSVELTKRLEGIQTYTMSRDTVLSKGLDMERRKIDIQFLQDKIKVLDILARLKE